jgi:transcription-repair coupling factor (superfamily II helicase)
MLQENLIRLITECAKDVIHNLSIGSDSDPEIDLFKSASYLGDLPSLKLRRSARLPFLAAIYSEVDRPILLITDRTDRALTLSDELSLLAPQALLVNYPEPSPLFYENAPWGRTTRRDRLVALTTLASYHIPGAQRPPLPPLIIAPARALMVRTLPRREFLKAVRILKPSQSIDMEALVRDLIERGYEPVNTVITPGQFARRGGIVDLWPPAENQPARLDFFGDELEAMRSFDPSTQRTVSKTESLMISPAREYLKPVFQESEVTDIDQYTEFHIPVLNHYPSSLLDYLPSRALVLIDNLEDFQEAVQEIEEQAVELRADHITDPLPDIHRITRFTYDGFNIRIGSLHNT